MNPHLSIPRDQLAAFCQDHGIKRLAIFGSALRQDFGPESDVDVLVEFEPDRVFLGCWVLPAWKLSCPMCLAGTLTW